MRNRRLPKVGIPSKPTPDCQQGYYIFQYRCLHRAERFALTYAAIHGAVPADCGIKRSYQRRVVTYDINGKQIAVGSWGNCPPGEYRG